MGGRNFSAHDSQVNGNPLKPRKSRGGKKNLRRVPRENDTTLRLGKGRVRFEVRKKRKEGLDSFLWRGRVCAQADGKGYAGRCSEIECCSYLSKRSFEGKRSNVQKKMGGGETYDLGRVICLRH